ncbi:MAG: aminotransferase class IV [Sphaerochaetaceae bacterium]|nr:aminotransferase class IV [Sphaerochaetaceae bacterium]
MNQHDRASLNGRIIDRSECLVSIDEPAFQAAYSVYETMKYVDSRLIYVQDHIARLFRSAHGLDIVHPFEQDQIITYIRELLSHGNLTEASIRVTLTGGKEPRLYITTQPLLAYPETYYREGVKAITYRGERYLPQFKTGNLLLNHLSRSEAARRGAFEALLQNNEGFLLEGSRTNLFALKGDTLYTAPTEMVLEGVTRDHILLAARELSLAVEYELLAYETVIAGHYDGLFISSTSMGALPLCCLDDTPLPFVHQHTGKIHALIRSWEHDVLP